MEREPKSSKSYEYKLVTAGKETKLHKKIDEAVTQGFAPVTMITIGEHVIVTEKEINSEPIARSRFSAFPNKSFQPVRDNVTLRPR